MTFILRQARQSIWNGEEIVTEERRGDARMSFARRPEDTDGVSVYAVAGEEQERLIVAALACTKMERSKMDLLRLEDEEVARFGPVATVRGWTSVKTANALHRALDWAPDVLMKLADHLLAEKRKSKRYQPADVKGALLALNPDDIEEGKSRDWLLELHATNKKPA